VRFAPTRPKLDSELVYRRNDVGVPLKVDRFIDVNVYGKSTGRGPARM
jgi:hypothetical protein